MDAWLVVIIGALGCVIGAAVSSAWFLSHRARLQIDLTRAETRSEHLETQLADKTESHEALQNEAADVARRREEAELVVAAHAERIKTLEQTEARLKEAFDAASARALHANSKQFVDLAAKSLERIASEARGDAKQSNQAIEALVTPIRELLARQDTAVREIEKKREVAYAGLTEQIRSIAESHGELRTETSRLVTALRRPEQRGRWGEMQLRNVVELSGMSPHCDFHEQPETDDPDSRDRPDMTVRMPGGGVVIVDAKVAIDAYLESLEPDADRESLLERHVGQVQTHCRRLGEKAYWKQFDQTPRFVIMFVPVESALVAAIERKPELHAAAMERNVLIATPTLLIALLRAVAYGWQQEKVTDNAREIAKVGSELHDRMATFVNHLDELGRRLGRATDGYNQTVGSLMSRVLPATRRLRDLHATRQDEVTAPDQIGLEPRAIQAIELKGPSDVEAVVSDVSGDVEDRVQAMGDTP